MSSGRAFRNFPTKPGVDTPDLGAFSCRDLPDLTRSRETCCSRARSPEAGGIAGNDGPTPARAPAATGQSPFATRRKSKTAGEGVPTRARRRKRSARTGAVILDPDPRRKRSDPARAGANEKGPAISRMPGRAQALMCGERRGSGRRTDGSGLGREEGGARAEMMPREAADSMPGQGARVEAFERAGGARLGRVHGDPGVELFVGHLIYVVGGARGAVEEEGAEKGALFEGVHGGPFVGIWWGCNWEREEDAGSPRPHLLFARPLDLLRSRIDEDPEVTSEQRIPSSTPPSSSEPSFT